MSMRRSGISASICLTVSSMQRASANEHFWRMTNVFQPRPTQLDREREGRLMIYHGVRNSDVHRAIEERFETVEAIMFTATIATNDDGQPLGDPETDPVVINDEPHRLRVSAPRCQ